MPLIIKLLGAGATNAGTVTDLYTAPASVQGVIVSNIRLTNTAGHRATINLFLVKGGSPFRILDRDKPIAAGDIVIVKPEITLGASDAIQVVTSAAMDFVVCGTERV